MCVNKDGTEQCGEGVRLQGKTVEKGEKGKVAWDRNVLSTAQGHLRTRDRHTERKRDKDREADTQRERETETERQTRRANIC